MIIYDCNHLRHHFYNLCAGSEVKHTQRPLSEKYHEQTKATNHLLHDKKNYIFTWNWSVDELWGCEEGYL